MINQSINQYSFIHQQNVQLCRLKTRNNIVVGLDDDDDGNNNNGMYSVYASVNVSG